MNRQQVMDYDTTNKNARWAFTALSVENKDVAVNDEIMIDKKTGEFYYKRPDGVVVKATSNSAVIDIINDLAYKIHQLESSENKFIFPESNNAIFLSVVHALAKRTENTNILQGVGPIVDLDIPLSKGCNGFFVKATTRSSDVRYVEILTRLYSEKHDVKLLTNATLEYTLTVLTNDNLTFTDTRTCEILLNEISFIPVDISMYEDVKSVNITINGVTSDILKEAMHYSELYEASCKQFITEDGKIIITDITTDYFVDDTSQIPTDMTTYGDVIKTLSTTVQVENTVYKTAGLSTEDRKMLDSIPKFNISEEYNEY